jgi:hypothetical protein
MPRRVFTDAKALLNDLLDRHEAGTAAPVADPDYFAFSDVSEIDRFVSEVSGAEAAAAVRLAKGRGRHGDQIAHVRLEDAASLHDMLGRRPVGDQAAEACARLLDGLDMPTAFDAPIAALSPPSPEYRIARRSLSSGRPRAGPGGGR